MVHNSMGEVYKKLGTRENLEEALKCFKEAKRIAVECRGENHEDVADVCSSLGVISQVYIYVYVYVYVYVHMYMFICVYVYVCIYVYMYVCIYVYMYICVDIYQVYV